MAVVGLMLNLAVLVAGAEMPVPPDRAGPQKNSGLAMSYAVPSSSFADAVDNGYGLSVIFDYPTASVADLAASLGWYRFAGSAGGEDVSMWEFTAGPRYRSGVFYAGVEMGYFTKVKEWGMVPNLGLRRGDLELGLRYKFSGEASFVAARLGFYF
jgi:hypothetical protein